MIDAITPVVNAGLGLKITKGKASQVLIMDPCPMIRSGLHQLLKGSLFKNGEVVLLNRASDVPKYLASDLPDVIVMELCGEGESVLEGLGVINACQKQCPMIPVVVCTSLTDVRFLQQLKSLGVVSICHKHDPLSAIERCIDFAMAGASLDSPAIQNLRLGHIQPPVTLTDKEIEVLEALLAGITVSRIAYMWHRDIRTVSTHKRNAMIKLGYKNDGELFLRGKWMARNGLFN